MTVGASGGPASHPPLVVIGGGVRSGKSRFALERAGQLGGPRRTFVATAEPLDGEMAERIARHRDERRGGGFTTLEEPLDLNAALGSAYATADWQAFQALKMLTLLSYALLFGVVIAVAHVARSLISR